MTLEARAHWSRWLQWGGADEGDFRRATELALVGPGGNRRKNGYFRDSAGDGKDVQGLHVHHGARDVEVLLKDNRKEHSP